MALSYPLLSPSEESTLLNALKEKCVAGWDQLQQEPSFLHIQDAIHFINGQHHLVESNALSKTYVNKARKVSNEVAAVLTDVRPIGSYESGDRSWKKGADVLTRCNRYWWRRNNVDRVLRQVLQFATVGGSGYLLLTWDSQKQDIIPTAVDPRDVIPIEPILSPTIQDWRGACVRTRVPLSDAHAMFPDKRDALKESSGNSWFGPEVNRVGGGIRRVVSSFWNSVVNRRRRFDPPGVEIMRIYYRDDSVNTTDHPVDIGEPGTNWFYTVPPGEKLWPRGKMVICTPDTILRVLPNIYWHARLPLVRFTLVDAAWSLNGLSIVQDIISLQHSLNESVRGLDDARNKILRPDIIVDRRAMGEAETKKIDSRLPGGMYRVDTQLTGSDGFKFGTPPDLGQYYLPHLQWLEDKIDELSGIKGIQAFQQLKQMPSHDTVQEFLQAMTPLLKDMARSLEVSVLEMADMMMFNFFQYYDTEKRVEIFGEEGLAPSDMEGEPGDMVPSGEGSPEERAKKVGKQFKFAVAPNTFLNISNMADRMFKLQLWGRGGLSTYSMWEAADIPNIGPEPGTSEPERMIAERKVGLLQGPPPELVQAQLVAAVAQAQATVAQLGAQMAMMQGGAQGAPPGAPPPPGGAGGPESAQEVGGAAPRGPGRPPSGTEVPTIEARDGGTRSVVSQT